jgi:hypothetical protein
LPREETTPPVTKMCFVTFDEAESAASGVSRLEWDEGPEF